MQSTEETKGGGGGLSSALDGLEDDMDIENEDELMEDQNKAKLASEINMVKVMSEEMLADGTKKLR